MNIRPGICRVLVDQVEDISPIYVHFLHEHQRMLAGRVVASGPVRHGIRQSHVGEIVAFPAWAVNVEFEVEGHACAIIYASAIDGVVEK